MRPLLAILLAAATASATSGPLRSAADACAAGLWDIGSLRYESALAGGGLSAAQRKDASLRLAEALVRSEQAERALDLLKSLRPPAHPESYFWRGQALAATGKRAEAADVLAAALGKADAPHRSEALLTRASLLLELNRPQDALLCLKPLAESEDPATAALAHLRQAEILLDQGGPTAARAIIPNPEALPARHRREAALVQGRILLARGETADAGPVFRSLLEHPERLTLRDFHSAALGLADVLSVEESPRSGLDFLLKHATAHPETPLADELFARVLHWLPAKVPRDAGFLATLAAWVPALPPAPPVSINPRLDAPESLWPANSASTPLAPYAMRALAEALRRSSDEASHARAQVLLTRLRLEYPSHPFSIQASLEQAQRLLTAGDPAAADYLLDHLPADLPVPGAAHFLHARAAYEKGDAKDAIGLFEAAAAGLKAERKAAALLNAGMLRLAGGLKPALITNGKTTDPDDPAASPEFRADLSLEEALATPEAGQRKAALDAFLEQHPEHPRLAEILLSTAEAALAVHPPDSAAARQRLAALAALDAEEPAPANPPDPARLALAKTLLAGQEGDPAAIRAASDAFLSAFPEHPGAAEVRLLLGHTLADEGDFNRARMTYEKLAATENLPPDRAQAAWLLAARAAAMVPTPQSREEALGLHDKALAIQGPLAAVSRLEKARLLLDLDRPGEVPALLGKWLEALPKNDPLRLPGGLLLAEAAAAANPEEPAALTRALALYQELLKHPATDAANRHRIKFLCGDLLERLPDPRQPNTKRIPEAIATYYSVLEEAGAKPPAEWEWFERCGFRALELYSAAERWQPAIAIARKIASFNGPRAAEAAKQAELLQLRNMVWED